MKLRTRKFGVGPAHHANSMTFLHIVSRQFQTHSRTSSDNQDVFLHGRPFGLSAYQLADHNRCCDVGNGPNAVIVLDTVLCYPFPMIRAHSRPLFSVLELLKRSSSQAVWPDALFFSVGRALGPPSSWDFSGDSVAFGSLLDYYGNLQIELWIRGEQVEVRRVGIRMWTLSDGVPVPKLGKMKYRSRCYVESDGFEPGLSIGDAKSLLDKASIAYTEKAVANMSETVAELNLQDNTYLQFFMMEGRPSLASIQAYSQHEGA
jgi:hypothetical protein